MDVLIHFDVQTPKQSNCQNLGEGVGGKVITKQCYQVQDCFRELDGCSNGLMDLPVVRIQD